MKSSEKYDLWQVEKLRDLDESHELVKNLNNGNVMIRCRLPAESYQLMKKLSSMRHQNLMTVYDCECIDSYCVCLCEYIDGETIEQRINRCGTFNEQQATAILSQICDALSSLHGEGIIHRDVTASNVMLTNSSTAKLIDYDIARSVKENISRDTQILGTVGYASPEQFGFSQTGVRADIYACGALLNVMLTGALAVFFCYRTEARADKVCSSFTGRTARQIPSPSGISFKKSGLNDTDFSLLCRLRIADDRIHQKAHCKYQPSEFRQHKSCSAERCQERFSACSGIFDPSDPYPLSQLWGRRTAVP